MGAGAGVLGLLQELARWLGPVFTTAGYAIVPAVVFLETAALIGWVVPGDVTMALAGVYAARGDLALEWILTSGVVAAIAGQTGGYWLGRRYGRSIIQRVPFVRRVEPRMEEASAFLRRHGGKAVMLGRFATGVSSFVPFTAGTAGMPFPRFLAFMIPTSLVWVSAVVLLGYLLGRNLALIDRVLSGVGWVVLAVVLLLLGGAWLWHRRRNQGGTDGR